MYSILSLIDQYMELLFPFVVLFCVFLVTYFTLTRKPGPANQKPFHDHDHLPPGRTGWPIVGETLEYYTKLKNGKTDQFVTERMSKYSSPKVFRTSLLGHPMAILPGAEGNKLIFSNENKLVQAWMPSSIDKLFPRSGDVHIRDDFVEVRKMLNFLLKGDVLPSYVEVMDEIMKQRLSRDWIDRGEVKVDAVVKKFTVGLSCRLMLGIEEPRTADRLAKSIDDIATGMVAMPINLPGTAYWRAKKCSKLIRGEIEEIILQRKVEILEEKKLLSPTMQDVLSRMILSDGQFLREADIASYVAALLVAGYDTLGSTMIVIMKYLAEHPDVYNHVLKEQLEIAKSKASNELLSWDDARKMRYSWNVATEVLRLMPPGVGTFREAITDFTYAGYVIPKGWKIHWFTQVTHMNPEYFPNPEKFDPTRFEGNKPPPYAYVPFGAGLRMCPANEYSRLVILVFMHNVVTKFRWEKVLLDEKVTFGPHPKLTQGFPVRLYPHNP